MQRVCSKAVTAAPVQPATPNLQRDSTLKLSLHSTRPWAVWADLVLCELNFKVESGCKFGVVGCTGAAVTALLAATVAGASSYACICV